MTYRPTDRSSQAQVADNMKRFGLWYSRMSPWGISLVSLGAANATPPS